jgi:hypothetical protein
MALVCSSKALRSGRSHQTPTSSSLRDVKMASAKLVGTILNYSSFLLEVPYISSSFPKSFHTAIFNHGCSATSVLVAIPSDQSSTDLAVISDYHSFYVIPI